MIINKELYTKICNICDFILTDFDTNIRRVSISWLHVIRPHPIILERYQKLFINDHNNINKYFFNFILIKKIFIIIGRITLSILKTKSFFYSNNYIHKNEDKIDYLFVSHLLNSNEFEREDDFYFQKTIINLNHLGYNTVTLLFNHTNVDNSCFKFYKKLTTKKIILSNRLSFFTEIYILIQLLIESYLLFKKSKLYNHDTFKKNIIIESSRECVTFQTIDNLRKYYQFKNLIKKLNPKKIIATYEGHAWERLLFHAAKEHSSNILCYGYQHTSLFKLQHAALRKLDILYNPDIILTPGELSNSIFKNSEIGRNIPVYILGSNRGMHSNATTNTLYKKNKTCLVIPEGFDSECLILFRFIIMCSNFSNSVNFILKLHPMMNKQTFINNFPEFNILPNNVSWASNNINEDFLKCNWVLYRGSTMIVQACQNNLIPIYYEYNVDEISLDLLEDVADYKSSVNNVDDFFKTINDERNNYNKDKVISYCTKLYQNFDYSILVN
jgi:hypothetical protein